MIPTKHCKTYPNNKPWINWSVVHAMCALCCMCLGWHRGLEKGQIWPVSINETGQETIQTEAGGIQHHCCYYTTADPGSMWQGLQHITDCKQKTNSSVRSPQHQLKGRNYGQQGHTGHNTLCHHSVPTCFKSTTIVPLPKKDTVTCLNDCWHLNLFLLIPT